MQPTVNQDTPNTWDVDAETDSIMVNTEDNVISKVSYKKYAVNHPLMIRDMYR
jgi:hypothetical protein